MVSIVGKLSVASRDEQFSYSKNNRKSTTILMIALLLKLLKCCILTMC
jgi:hypothetical protein